MHQASWAPGGHSSFDCCWMQPLASTQQYTSEYATTSAHQHAGGCAAFVAAASTAPATAQPQQQHMQQQLPGNATFSPAAANLQLQADLAALQSMQQQLSLQDALAQQLLQCKQHVSGSRVSDGGHAPDGSMRSAPLGAPGAAAGASAGATGSASAQHDGAAAGAAAAPVGGAAAAAAAAGAAAGAAAAAAGSTGASAGGGGALPLSPAAALAAVPAQAGASGAAPGCSASLASLMFESARSVYQRALAEARAAAETLASASAAVEAAQASLAAASAFITQMMDVNAQLADPTGAQAGSSNSSHDQQQASAAAACSRKKQKAKKKRQQQQQQQAAIMLMAPGSQAVLEQQASMVAAAAPSVPLPPACISGGFAAPGKSGRARSVSMGASSCSFTGTPTASEPVLRQELVSSASGTCMALPHVRTGGMRPLGQALSEPIPMAAAAAAAAVPAPVAFNVLAEFDDLADNWLEGLPPLSPATTDALAHEAASLPVSAGCGGLVLPAPLPQQAYALAPPALPAVWPATSRNGSESPTKKRRTSPCAASPAAAASAAATPASTGRCGSTEAADSVDMMLDNMLCNMVQAAPNATLSVWQSVLQQHGAKVQQPQVAVMQQQLPSSA